MIPLPLGSKSTTGYFLFAFHFKNYCYFSYVQNPKTFWKFLMERIVNHSKLLLKGYATFSVNWCRYIKFDDT